MERLDTLTAWRSWAEAVRDRGGRVGLVATMGALHAGHAALMEAARRRGDEVLVTIFVNPRQFNDPGDLAAYPRDLEGDLALCERAGAAAVAVPQLAEMWPSWPSRPATTVSVAGVADGFEGAGRPGHFDGVASVVAKLLAVTGPCRAYFGEKDFQQLAVVTTMVRDLALPVEVVPVPIVRDPDGLALSSRNVRLSPAGRERALGLSRALFGLDDGTARSASGVRERLAGALADSGIDVAYADVVDPVSLRPLTDEDEGEARVLLAGLVDGVRLLDNARIVLVRGSRAAGH